MRETTWKRFDRWSRKGAWERLFEALQDPDLEWPILGSAITRARPAVAEVAEQVGVIGPGGPR